MNHSNIMEEELKDLFLSAIRDILGAAEEVEAHGGFIDIYTPYFIIELKRSVNKHDDHNAKEQARRYAGTHWVISAGIDEETDTYQLRIPIAMYKHLSANSQVWQEVGIDPTDPDYMVINVVPEKIIDFFKSLRDFTSKNYVDTFNNVFLAAFYDPLAPVLDKELLDTAIVQLAQQLGFTVSESDMPRGELIKNLLDVPLTVDKTPTDKPARQLQEKLRELWAKLNEAQNSEQMCDIIKELINTTQEYGLVLNEDIIPKETDNDGYWLTYGMYLMKTLAMRTGVVIGAESFTNRDIQMFMKHNDSDNKKEKTLSQSVTALQKSLINSTKENILSYNNFALYYNTIGMQTILLDQPVFAGGIMYTTSQALEMDLNGDFGKWFKKMLSIPKGEEVSIKNLENEIKDYVILAVETLLASIFRYGNSGKAINVKVEIGKNSQTYIEIQYHKDGIEISTIGPRVTTKFLSAVKKVSWEQIITWYQQIVSGKRPNIPWTKSTSEKTIEKETELLKSIIGTAIALRFLHGDNKSRLEKLSESFKDFTTNIVILLYRREITDSNFNKLLTNLLTEFKDAKQYLASISQQELSKKLIDFARIFLSSVGKYKTTKQILSKKQKLSADEYAKILMYLITGQQPKNGPITVTPEQYKTILSMLLSLFATVHVGLLNEQALSQKTYLRPIDIVSNIMNKLSRAIAKAYDDNGKIRFSPIEEEMTPFMHIEHSPYAIRRVPEYRTILDLNGLSDEEIVNGVTAFLKRMAIIERKSGKNRSITGRGRAYLNSLAAGIKMMVLLYDPDEATVDKWLNVVDGLMKSLRNLKGVERHLQSAKITLMAAKTKFELRKGNYQEGGKYLTQALQGMANLGNDKDKPKGNEQVLTNLISAYVAAQMLGYDETAMTLLKQIDNMFQKYRFENLGSHLQELINYLQKLMESASQDEESLELLRTHIKPQELLEYKEDMLKKSISLLSRGYSESQKKIEKMRKQMLAMAASAVLSKKRKESFSQWFEQYSELPLSAIAEYLNFFMTDNEKKELISNLELFNNNDLLDVIQETFKERTISNKNSLHALSVLLSQKSLDSFKQAVLSSWSLPAPRRIGLENWAKQNQNITPHEFLTYIGMMIPLEALKELKNKIHNIILDETDKTIIREYIDQAINRRTQKPQSEKLDTLIAQYKKMASKHTETQQANKTLREAVEEYRKLYNIPKGEDFDIAILNELAQHYDFVVSAQAYAFIANKTPSRKPDTIALHQNKVYDYQGEVEHVKSNLAEQATEQRNRKNEEQIQEEEDNELEQENTSGIHLS